MARLDRLGWADGISFRAFGVRIGIRVREPEALARVAPLLPPGWKLSCSPVVDLLYSLISGDPVFRPGTRNLNLLYRGAARLARVATPDQVLEVLESDLHLRIAELA